MQAFTKTVYEEVYLYHEFKRLDGKGWLGDGEAISIATVTLTEKDTGVAVAGMIDGVQSYANTKVVYKVTGGTAGKKYVADIKIATDQGQKFEDKIEIRIAS